MFRDFKSWEIAVVVFSCLASAFLLGMSVESYIQANGVTPYGLPFYDDLSNKSADVRQCANKSVVDTAFCIKRYIDTFYNYVPRNETNYSEGEGTLEDVKENGGDCSDYSGLFSEMAKELGYNSRIIELSREDRVYGHDFAIMYDANLTAYCHFDVGKSETMLTCYKSITDININNLSGFVN